MWLVPARGVSTVKTKVASLTILPLVPRIVTLYVPSAAFKLDMVIVVLPLGATGLVVKLATVPGGRLSTEKVR